MTREKRNEIVSAIICADLLSINGMHIDDFEVTATVEDSVEITGTFNNKPFNFFCDNICDSKLSNDEKVLTVPVGVLNDHKSENISIRCFNYQQVPFKRYSYANTQQ